MPFGTRIFLQLSYPQIYLCRGAMGLPIGDRRRHFLRPLKRREEILQGFAQPRIKYYGALVGHSFLQKSKDKGNAAHPRMLFSC